MINYEIFAGGEDNNYLIYFRNEILRSHNKIRHDIQVGEHGMPKTKVCIIQYNYSHQCLHDKSLVPDVHTAVSAARPDKVHTGGNVLSWEEEH